MQKRAVTSLFSGRMEYRGTVRTLCLCVIREEDLRAKVQIQKPQRLLCGLEFSHPTFPKIEGTRAVANYAAFCAGFFSTSMARFN